MHNELTDIQIVQKYFGLDENKSQSMITLGLNMEYIRNGYIKNEETRIKNKYKLTVDDIVNTELLN